MYQRIIKEEMARMGYIGKYDPRHVEAYMRLGQGCLDGLSKQEFIKEIKIGMACIDNSKTSENEALAKSFGL